MEKKETVRIADAKTRSRVIVTTSVIGIAIAPGIYHIGYLFCMDTYPP